MRSYALTGAQADIIHEMGMLGFNARIDDLHNLSPSNLRFELESEETSVQSVQRS